MSTSPEDVANRALDSIGVTTVIGDLQEGSREAKALLRTYGPALRQLARSANWNCLRKQTPLVLLNDASGATTAYQVANNLPQTVGTGTTAMLPWVYEYRWPNDCVLARFVPTSMYPTNLNTPAGNISLPTTPLFTGANQNPFSKQMPAPFLVTTDNIPNLVGVPERWTDLPDTSQTMGQGTTSQTVILTNQAQATLVYTALITYPDQWDSLFSEAFEALLASRVALTLIQDRRIALQARDEAIKIAKGALDLARVRDGDEGFTSISREASWMTARNVLPAGAGWGGFSGNGQLWGNYDALSFGDGSAY